jgi:hypothetical protein
MITETRSGKRCIERDEQKELERIGVIIDRIDPASEDDFDLKIAAMTRDQKMDLVMDLGIAVLKAIKIMPKLSSLTATDRIRVRK